jgi:negative regulator of sigma E activity
MKLVIEWFKMISIDSFISKWKEYYVDAVWPIHKDGILMGFSIYVNGVTKYITNYKDWHIGQYKVYTKDSVQLN